MLQEDGVSGSLTLFGPCQQISLCPEAPQNLNAEKTVEERHPDPFLQGRGCELAQVPSHGLPIKSSTLTQAASTAGGWGFFFICSLLLFPLFLSAELSFDGSSCLTSAPGGSDGQAALV